MMGGECIVKTSINMPQKVPQTLLPKGTALYITYAFKVKRPPWSTKFSISRRGILKHEPLTKKDAIKVHVSRTLLNHSRTCLIIQEALCDTERLAQLFQFLEVAF